MKDTSVEIPAEKTGKLGTWGIGNYAQYRYDLFNRSDRFSGPWYGKTFRNTREADPEIFSAIDDYKPNYFSLFFYFFVQIMFIFIFILLIYFFLIKVMNEIKLYFKMFPIGINVSFVYTTRD